MKKVICLYRVSTIGQVDHDDIPMQRLACREYAKTHPDWEIIDEISEKGISGYKVSATDRDAIVEIKKRAAQAGGMMKRPSWCNGSCNRASRSGARGRENSGLITTWTSS